MSDKKLTEREIARQRENIKRDAEKAAALMSRVKANVIALVHNLGGLVRDSGTGEVWYFLDVYWTEGGSLTVRAINVADGIKEGRVADGFCAWDDLEILRSDTPLPPHQKTVLETAYHLALQEHPEWRAARDKAHAEIEARVEAGEKLTDEDKTKIVDDATTAAEDKLCASGSD
jgi:hypothetical protein